MGERESEVDWRLVLRLLFLQYRPVTDLKRKKDYFESEQKNLLSFVNAPSVSREKKNILCTHVLSCKNAKRIHFRDKSETRYILSPYTMCKDCFFPLFFFFLQTATTFISVSFKLF